MKKILTSIIILIAIVAAALYVFYGQTITYDYQYTVVQKTQQDCPDSTNCTNIYLSFPVFEGGFWHKGKIKSINKDIYVQITGAAERTPEIMVEEFFSNFYKDIKTRSEMFPNDKFYPAWSYSAECVVLINAPELIVTELDFYQYEGGAHGIGGKAYTNYNISTGSELKLDDVFTDSIAVTKVVTECFVKQKNLDPSKPFIQQGYFIDSDVLPVSYNFALLPKGVIFYYSVYEIAPYYFGATEVLVPYTALEGLMKYTPDFKNADIFEQNPENINEDI